MYKAPTVTALSQSLRAAIRAALPQTDPWIWPNNLAIASKVFAQALRGAYLRLEWIHRQQFTLSADDDYLDRHGAQVGISRNPALHATGGLGVSTEIGTVIASGTQFVRTDGVRFESVADVTATTTGTLVVVQAVESGNAGNTDGGSILRLVTPITGVGDAEVEPEGLFGGQDEENTETYRARILDRKRNPALGGSPAEYVRWVRQMVGVTRVFVKRATPQPGSVTVLFMMDDAYADGIPTLSDSIQLRDLLESLAPADAEVIVTAPIAQPVNVVISGLIPDSAVVRNAIQVELQAMFRRRAQPGTSLESFTFSQSWIVEAVAIAARERSHHVDSPAVDVVVGDGIIPTLGTVTFV